MPEDIPQSAKNAAILQIVSGVVNLFVMPGVVFAATWVVGLVCGTCTFGIGTLASLCGFVSCLLPPIGIAEIIVGAVALANPRQGIPFGRILAFVEIASLLAGGIVSAVIGILVMRMYGDDEVTAYLESA